LKAEGPISLNDFLVKFISDILKGGTKEPMLFKWAYPAFSVD